MIKKPADRTREHCKAATFGTDRGDKHWVLIINVNIMMAMVMVVIMAMVMVVIMAMVMVMTVMMTMVMMMVVMIMMTRHLQRFKKFPQSSGFIQSFHCRSMIMS